MAKVLLWKDEVTIYRNIESVKGTIAGLKTFFERYKGLGLSDMQTEDLKDFINNPKNFFVKILTNGESLKIGQLELNPQKVYDLFPLPDGVNDLVVDINNFTAEYSYSGSYSYNIQHIKIVENQLTVSNEYIDSQNEKMTYYTESEDQEKAVTLLKRIAKDVTSLKALQKGSFYNPQDWIKESLIEKKTETGIEYTENLQKVRLF
ncbi:hypothetical protein [Epilithonimonas tenax]|uniref:hypothetical protein n=1 Tax=Epilithonimonas tenax TaxID=191577 RepID=UPI0003FEF0E9|nr:hypothetical protein [Epilithonimonas tenax]